MLSLNVPAGLRAIGWVPTDTVCPVTLVQSPSGRHHRRWIRGGGQNRQIHLTSVALNNSTLLNWGEIKPQSPETKGETRRYVTVPWNSWIHSGPIGSKLKWFRGIFPGLRLKPRRQRQVWFLDCWFYQVSSGPVCQVQASGVNWSHIWQRYRSLDLKICWRSWCHISSDIFMVVFTTIVVPFYY